jgi:hypothetical protein
VDTAPDQDECCGLGWEIIGPPEPQLRGQFARAADARLIAAAPDLLAALQRLVRDHDAMVDTDIEVRANGWIKARAALAKASA